MREVIYKGATRPPVLFGVPLVPGMIVAGAGSVAGAWSAFLLHSAWYLAAVAALVLPALAWMRMVTKKDDQRVLQYLRWLQLTLLHRNRALWGGCRSYSPIVYRGARDALGK